MTTLLSAFTVYFLYGMSSIPFIVWAARGAYRGTLASSGVRPWPGVLSTVARIILPLALILVYVWNLSAGTNTGALTGEAVATSEWMPYQFLLLPPAFGSIIGYGIGYLVGKRARVRAV